MFFSARSNMRPGVATMMWTTLCKRIMSSRKSYPQWISLYWFSYVSSSRTTALVWSASSGWGQEARLEYVFSTSLASPGLGYVCPSLSSTVLNLARMFLPANAIGIASSDRRSKPFSNMPMRSSLELQALGGGGHPPAWVASFLSLFLPLLSPPPPPLVLLASEGSHLCVCAFVFVCVIFFYPPIVLCEVSGCAWARVVELFVSLVQVSKLSYCRFFPPIKCSKVAVRQSNEERRVGVEVAGERSGQDAFLFPSFSSSSFCYVV